jgi:hypothetical protein
MIKLQCKYNKVMWVNPRMVLEIDQFNVDRMGMYKLSVTYVGRSEPSIYQFESLEAFDAARTELIKAIDGV